MDSEFYLNLSAPLKGATATGMDAVDSDETIQLLEEIGKGEGLNIQRLDWAKIEHLSVTILAEQSKDLRVAGYLVMALHEQYGFAGLATGLQFFADIVNADYWADLYPKRKKKQNKARAASFAWVLPRIETVLQTLEVTQDSDFSALIAAAKAFDQADTALHERLADEAPKTMEVKNRFKRVVQEAQAWIEQAKPEPEPQPEVRPSAMQRAKEVLNSVKEAIIPTSEPTPAEDDKAADSTDNPPVIAAAAVTRVARADIDDALESGSKTMNAVVAALRHDSVYDPWAFYLSRTANWMVLDVLPPDGLMPINPSEQHFEALQLMAKNQQYQLLIETAEKLFDEGAIYNMALQRLVVNALEAQGAMEAGYMIKTCLGQLLTRLPGLMTRKFSAQLPFVDDLTKAWLESTSISFTGNNENADRGNGGGQAGSEAAPWLAGLAQAKGVLGSGTFDEAIGVLSQGIATASGLRERTYWQLAQARLCDSAGHTDLAVSQLQYLETRVNGSLPVQWEPSLRIDIITTLLQCHVKKMDKTTYTAEQKQALAPLYSELSLTAPVVALSISIN